MHLLTPEQLHLARQRVADDQDAGRIADAIFAAAAGWLKRDDQAIRDLMPEARVPRTWTVNYITGCPIHGSGPAGLRGYAQGGWHCDPFEDRWRVTCAVGGETYPSNDFEAFYQTGMQDRSLLEGAFADDGWGWRAEDALFGHWFVAYCCENLWQTVMAGLTALYQAYLLSGQARYAHKALVILDRLAEVYPDMDYSTQSMYAREFSPGYDGKMFNQISEAGNLCRLCRALDAVRDALPEDPVFGGQADAMRAKLERGIVGAGLDGVYRGKVRSNYGGHQEALLMAALVSGDQQEIDRAVDWVLNHTGEATTLKEMLTSFDDYIFRDKAAHAEGLNFALDNLIFREGVGWESSPSYNSGWLTHIATIAALLEPLGVRLWDRPKIRRMFRWPTEMTCLDQFTPAIGDAGSARDGRVQLAPGTLRTVYAATRDPFIGELLRQCRGGFDSFEALFSTCPTPDPSRESAARIRNLKTSSRLLGGFGLALLCSGRGDEQCAVSLYYGRAATEHAHFDRLNLELFAYQKKLVPDLGYGEHAAEGDRPAVWTKNTLPHTTVVVDARRQDTQAPGRLVLFSAATGLSLVEIDAPDTYHATSEYRRTTALVDLGPDARYVLDLFRVAGGDQHDYSFHGFDGTFRTEGLVLAPQTRGTLAGEEIPLGAIYDDEGLVDPKRKGRSYYTYRGGGYSYLYNARKGRPEGTWSASWQDKDIGLKTFFLPSQQAVIAHGDPPRKSGNPKQLTYVLLRHAGNGIASQFAAVAEPFKGRPRVHAVELLDQNARTITLKVHHQQGADTICHAVDPEGTCFSLVRCDPEGRPIRLDLVGVGQVAAGNHTLAIEKPLSGRVVSVDPATASIEVERDPESQPFRAGRLVGEIARIGNDRRATAYTITAVEGRGRRFRISFGDDSFCIGRFVVTGLNADGSGLSTRTYLYLAAQGYYRGARLVDQAHQNWLPVEDVTLSPHRPGCRRDGSVGLVGKHDLEPPFAPDRIAYLYDFGPGDTFSVVPRATAIRRADNTFRITGNSLANLSVE